MKIISPKNSTRAASLRRGFTLIELLLVLTILAILAGIVLPSFINRSKDAKVTAAKVEIKNMTTALSVFEVDNGHYPKSSDGLQALLVRPRDADNWKGPYLQTDKMSSDPWQHPYVYVNPGKHNPTSYDLYSMGIDGKGGSDMIGNWTQN